MKEFLEEDSLNFSLADIKAKYEKEKLSKLELLEKKKK